MVFQAPHTGTRVFMRRAFCPAAGLVQPKFKQKEQESHKCRYHYFKRSIGRYIFLFFKVYLRVLQPFIPGNSVTEVAL